ncbi:replication protein A large subunit [Striga asiatica]|uniref:Replication protein A large subunit n=1 Tax=Striga asiatica TaxID=4170 RepID=A0A5A7R7P6_STRAF|nr:replication protein A large subunit [Striga asiatica]GER53735.1 replication protein A large subunit [Striga asiatica]
MARFFGTLADVNRATQPFLTLRVVSILESNFELQSNNNIQILFHDEHGSRINAIIRSPSVGLYRDVFKLGKVYAIHNYNVEFNNQRINTTGNRWMLVLNSRTKIYSRAMETFHQH